MYELYVPKFRNTLFRLHRWYKHEEQQVILPAYTTYEHGTERVFRNVGT